MQISVLIGTVGACDFLFLLSCPVLSCPVLFFLGNAPRSNRWTDFYALWLKQRVSA